MALINKAPREQNPPKHALSTYHLTPNGCDTLVVTRLVVHGFHILVLL